MTGPTDDPLAGVQVFFGAIDESSPGLNLARRRALRQIAFTDEFGRFRVATPQAHWTWKVDMRVRLDGRTVHWETSGALRELRENVKRVRLDVGPTQRTPTDKDR
ncbi:MAG: hypothetical protein KDC95_16840 [Planctomycetes bacterium]|nr:hypothetical protein [Planctomycetota bacterium]